MRCSWRRWCLKHKRLSFVPCQNIVDEKAVLCFPPIGCGVIFRRYGRQFTCAIDISGFLYFRSTQSNTPYSYFPRLSSRTPPLIFSIALVDLSLEHLLQRVNLIGFVHVRSSIDGKSPALAVCGRSAYFVPSGRGKYILPVFTARVSSQDPRLIAVLSPPHTIFEVSSLTIYTRVSTLLSLRCVTPQILASIPCLWRRAHKLTWRVP
jgi:hypothetical protein